MSHDEALLGIVLTLFLLSEYNYMKEELSKFLKGFSEDKKVYCGRN